MDSDDAAGRVKGQGVPPSRLYFIVIDLYWLICRSNFDHVMFKNSRFIIKLKGLFILHVMFVYRMVCDQRKQNITGFQPQTALSLQNTFEIRLKTLHDHT